MQTFVPSTSMVESALSLDAPKRLGAMIKESAQILGILASKHARSNMPQIEHATYKIAWEHHPAVLMWEGYADALMLYCACCYQIWRGRGYNDHQSFHNAMCDSVEIRRVPATDIDRIAQALVARYAATAVDAIVSQLRENNPISRPFSCDSRRAICVDLKDVPIFMPPWWDGPIHLSHRRALARALPTHYQARFGWEPADEGEELFWPVRAGATA